MADRVKAKPLRVLHVIEATVGGTRRWLEETVPALDPGRVCSACVCSVEREPSFRETIREFRARGVPVWEVPMRREINLRSDWRAVNAVARILRRERFDVVHGHSAKGGMIARLAARMSGFDPVVYTPHAFAFLCGGARGWLYRRIERGAVFATDAVLAVSQSEAGLAVELGYAPERVYTVLNGICLKEPVSPPAAGDECIGTVAGLREQKDPRCFLEICAHIHALRPKLRFVLCGQGPLEGRLRKEAADLGLAGSLGFVTDCREPAALMKRWNVFLLCSRYEGLSYALLDAMGAGMPVVATAVPGTEEVVEDGRSGRLFRRGDSRGGAEAVLRLLDDPVRARTMGAAARLRVSQRHRIEDQLDGLTVFYETVAAAHERRAREERWVRTSAGMRWRDDGGGTASGA